jgi:parallel beta-helix repeat protein
MQSAIISLIKILLTFHLVMFLSPTVQAQYYCETGSYSNDITWIESIMAGEYFIESGPFHNNYGDQDHLWIGYDDQSALTLNLQVGVNPLELIPGRLNHPVMNDFPSIWQVWLDTDGNFEFSQDELYFSGSSFDAIYTHIDLSTLQLNSELVTRMRISVSIFDSTPSCGSIGYGEVEDYTVRITPVLPNTLHVPEEYATIQAAIDAAVPGNHIVVNDGIYPEHLIIDTPNITIESVNGHEFTNITGALNHDAIWVRSAGVSIIGFDLSGPRESYRNGILFDEGADDGRALNIHCGSNPEGLVYDHNININKADRVTISGLICEARGWKGIVASYTTGSVIKNNEITGSILSGISLYQSLDVIIDDNVMSENGKSVDILQSGRILAIDNYCGKKQPTTSGTGFYIVDSFEVTLANNFCTNQHTGMNIRQSDGISLINNELTHNSSHGLVTEYTDHLLLDNNLIEYNQLQGANINFSEEVIVTDNQFRSNHHMGLMLWHTSNSLVENNDFQGNHKTFRFLAAHNNTFTGNRLEFTAPYNDCPFEIRYSNDNQIYLNSFIAPDSNYLCSEGSSGNIWNSIDVLPYELQNNGILVHNVLGNYYSFGDHTDSDGDGIVDVPQALPGNGTSDEYALSAIAEDFAVH